MKLLFLLAFLVDFAFAGERKAKCVADLTALHEARLQLQKDEDAHNSAYFEHNIYKVELYDTFKKADLKRIEEIISKAVVNCEGVISKDEMYQLKEHKTYMGDLVTY